MRVSTTAPIIVLRTAVGVFLLAINKDDTSNVSDAVIKQLLKSLGDAGNIQDSAALTFNKSTTDAAQLSDATEKLFAKFLNDAVDAGDSLSHTLLKVLNDEINAPDVLVLTFDKPLSDAFQAQDQVAKFISMILPQPYAIDYFAQDYVNDDIVKLTDAVIKTAQKGVSDTGIGADALHTALEKLLSDNALAQDALQQEFAKPLSSVFTGGDIVIHEFNKITIDNAQIADAGSLINQSYVDNNLYFASDYVGTSITF